MKNITNLRGFKFLFLFFGVCAIAVYLFFYPKIREEIDPVSGQVIITCKTKGVLYFKSEICTTYHGNGQISTIESLNNDVYDGEMRKFYDNGNLRYIIVYREGKIWNIETYKDVNGRNLYWGDLRDGDGWLRCFNSTGKLSSEGKVINGLKEGFWYLYSHGKIIIDSVNYDHGVREGVTPVDNLIY